MQGQENQDGNITFFSNEILLYILSYLPFSELVPLMSVCQLFNCLSKDNYFWRAQFQQRFLVQEPETKNLSPQSWYEHSHAAYLTYYQGLPKPIRIIFFKLQQHRLEAETNLNRKDAQGKTLLDWAATKGLVVIVKLLLQQGAKLEYTQHLLYWAALGGHVRLLRFLLQLGLDIDELDAKGRSALQGAVAANHPHGVAFLLRHQAKINDYKRLLFWSVRHGYVQVLNSLLARQININIGGIFRVTPLFCAIKHGQLAIVKLLVQHGAYIDVGWLWQTPLFLAVRLNHLKIAALLVKAGADIKHQPYYLLHWAVANAHIAFASNLIGLGLAIDSPDNLGNTPLHIAAFYAEEAMLLWLLDAGAKQNCINNNGQTPLQLAEHKGHIRIATHLSTYTLARTSTIFLANTVTAPSLSENYNYRL